MGLIDSIKHKLHPEVKEKFRNLFFNYKKGFEYFLSINKSLSRTYSTIFFPDMSYEDMKIVVDAESSIILYDTQIKKTESLRKWNNSYKERTQKSRNAWKKGCKFGVYKYDVTFPISHITGNPLRLSFTIWQHFLYVCYLGKDIEIPDSLRYLSNNAIVSPHYSDSEWDSILSQLMAIKEQFSNVCVLWGHTNTEIGKDTIINQCSYFRNKLSDYGIAEYFHDTATSIPDNSNIVIVDLFTINSDIKSYVPNLFSIICERNPFVTYISVKKEYDVNEIKAIVEETRNREAQEAERIREELERVEKEKKFRLELPHRLVDCVKSWESSAFGLKYKYLVDYYPVNKYDNASEDMWDDRWTVWNFKNTPGKITSERHDEALEEIVPRVTGTLNKSFGTLINYLTLVCVPASNSANHIARYEEFSEILCNKTGMDNSFDAIKITEDATPKHLGGTGSPVVSYNEDYFNGRFVVLFDDVITSGHSLHRMELTMEAMGATVVCAFTIGKTV